ncbi:WLM domain-containing protein [Podospora appendiculata]|uniref:WLM domain-containing protein n=1 Tax=Podospora appendiculata TaxID=314037 RepID=A0AAE1C9J9_9PEZI|nr:WLM domain-containing protein [Podospora appendiculata]
MADASTAKERQEEDVHPSSPSASSPSPAHDETPFSITIKFTPESYSQDWTFEPGTTFTDILMTATVAFPAYDWARCKAIPSRRAPALKPLLKSGDDDNVPLSPLASNTLKLMAPKITDLASLREASSAAAEAAAALETRRRARRRALKSHSTPRRQPQVHSLGSPQYTFHSIRPLQHLPNPARSQAFLERLAADPGIVATMRKHKFSVTLLTEMDPSEYTESTHEGTTRILGLNRNQGEVIELRLRTDAFDGYRDYRTIRMTLCHELAHNVHGPHDRNFWDLCHTIEREVVAADYTRSGRTVGEEEFAPERGGEQGEEEEFVDHAGWQGGSYVLGGAGEEGLSRREILARAAEKRTRERDGAAGDGSQGGRS